MINFSIKELNAFAVIGQEVELTNYQKKNIQISTQFWRKFNSSCISYFRMQKDYSGTEKCGSDLPKNTGETLYLGSTSSELYMCAYQKNYEQYVKNGTEIEDTEIKNRFEIRMKNERAYYAVVDLLTYRDAERTAFSIINHYVRFVDREDDKPKSQWITNDDWAWFVGENREPIRLTTKPEPYTLQKALHWLQRQVAPTIKMVQALDRENRTWCKENISFYCWQ